MNTKSKVEIDIIILSYAQTESLMEITNNCVMSLIDSEDSSKIQFNVVVIESQKTLKNHQYPFSNTIYPDKPFGYHRYMNIGIDATSAPYVCLCNNDIIFHKNWASEILKYMEQIPDLMSASPVSPSYHAEIGVPVNSGIRIGYRMGNEVTGWCLFMKRDIFKKIGRLDENYIFDAADYDYANTLGVMEIKHALITSSFVDHLFSTTLNIQDEERKQKLTTGNHYYDHKWTYRVLPHKM